MTEVKGVKELKVIIIMHRKIPIAMIYLKNVSD